MSSHRVFGIVGSGGPVRGCMCVSAMCWVDAVYMHHVACDGAVCTRARCMRGVCALAVLSRARTRPVQGSAVKCALCGIMW